MKYESLFSPYKMNSIMLRNRIMAAPMDIVSHEAMISSNYVGGISLDDKAAGGAGVVYLSADNDSPENGVFSKYNREKTREQLYILKQAGAKAGAEVMFFGRPCGGGLVSGPVSGIRFDGVKMQEITPSGMTEFANRLGRHCRNLKEFGFDTILIHFGHDSLCSQFLSPVFNSRTDEYGGSIENRVRFPREAAKIIREYVGKDFPLQMRISRELMVPESYDPDDMLYFIKSLDGCVDMINVSTGMDSYGGTFNRYIGNIHSVTTAMFPHMYSLEFAARIKETCGMPVSIVGAVSDPAEADEAIRLGKIDAVMLGRQLIADPYWPRKAQADSDDDIVPCLRCGNCFHFSTEHKNVVCSVNPRFRRENRVPLKLSKTANEKHVVVIGGGPAGCKAALTASERGHKVTLLEKSGRLGGKINTSDYDRDKIDLRRYRDYLVKQVSKHDIDVRCNVKANREYVEKLKPDAIIVAIGAESVTPPIKGVDSSNVMNVMELYDKESRPKGKVVIIGGGSVGCELALELSREAESVTVVEAAEKIAAASNITYRLSLDYFLEKHDNINILTSHTCEEITEDSVKLKNKTGELVELEADSVIISVGFKPNRPLVESFYGITPDTFEAGDCERVGTVCEATNYAYFVAASL